MHTNVIEVTFDSAHRLYEYEGKCHNVHGHTYVAILTIESNVLSGTGFVMDFGITKKWLKGWIDVYWDHATLLWDQDPLFKVMSAHTKIYSMGQEPTAENMAEALFAEAVEFLHMYGDIQVRSVGIKETPTTTAIYTL